MAALPHHRRAGAGALLALAASVALLLPTANAQSNMCYPKPNTRSRMKKGPCYMVTHTLPEFVDLDMPGALDPLANDFILADRRTAEPINSTCMRTKVYVSTDGMDIDLGHFKREAWATQAMTLVQGRLRVDFDALHANVAAMKQSRKFLKHNNTTELDTIFMVEFECPTTADTWRDNKAAHRTNYRAALRYVPPPIFPREANLGGFYGTFLDHIVNLYGAYSSAPYAPTPMPYAYAPTPFAAVASVGPSTDLPSELMIHRPICDIIRYAKTSICPWLGHAESAFLNFPTFVKSTSCKGQYPSFIQGFVDQGKNLARDKNDNPLPGTFANLLQQNGGILPRQVNWATIEAEKATLFWLYNQIQQLGAWTPCDNGQVPYAFANALAPGFSAPTFYRINNTYEFPESVNLTKPALAMSATGPDAASQNTFLLVVRGTIARSEWIADFQYNQVHVTDRLLNTRPLLAPFKGMKILAGYTGLFEQIYPSIKANVATAAPQRILVTGHSLGGGMTQLLALALALDFPSIPVDAAMFAPPAVGNAIFAETFNTKVNGRRVANVANLPTIWNLFYLKDVKLLSAGDPIPQTPCPTQPVCSFKNLLDPDVPVSTKTNEWIDAVRYTEVNGNVLFDYRHFPDPPASYDLPTNIIRDMWKTLDTVLNGLNAHKCSYACFLSSAVNVELTQCYFTTPKSQKIGQSNFTIGSIFEKLPPNVQDYGMC